MGESPSGPIHNQHEHKTPSLHLSNSRPSGLDCRSPKHSIGKPGCVCFSSHRPAAQGCTETQSQICRIILIAPAWPTKSWFGALVEMSLDIPRQLPPIRTLLKQPLNNQYHANPASLNPHVWYLGVQLSKNAGSLKKWQKELLLLKDSQREPSTPQNGQVFQKWCTEEQVDFRNPSISDICNFFWYLFNVLNRCPSPIEGYRTAIADTLGNTRQNNSNNMDIARLIASFYRDKPKSSRNIPKWNLSVVLHRLSQPPFEPQEQADLKFLTWKVVFLLDLASGKRHSKIHAWTLDGLLFLGDWEQVQLVPSPSFIAKNQLAIDCSSGNFHLEVQSRLQGHGYPSLPCQGPQVLSGQSQRLKRG